jgi:hypothetical protein
MPENLRGHFCVLQRLRNYLFAIHHELNFRFCTKDWAVGRFEILRAFPFEGDTFIRIQIG